MPILVPPHPRIWQGDIFEGVPWTQAKSIVHVTTPDRRQFTAINPPPSGGKGLMVVSGGLARAALLTHECVLDKRDNYPLTFARVQSLAGRDETLQGRVRDRSQLASFYLPDDGILGDECFIDLRLTTIVPAADLARFHRLASLSRDARYALRESISQFWTRPGDGRDDEDEAD